MGLAHRTLDHQIRKRLLGEVDVFQFDHTHELYAHMNITYVKLDRLPAFDRWGDALRPLAQGDFFTTTGEVLLPDVDWSSVGLGGRRGASPAAPGGVQGPRMRLPLKLEPENQNPEPGTPNPEPEPEPEP